MNRAKFWQKKKKENWNLLDLEWFFYQQYENSGESVGETRIF